MKDENCAYCQEGALVEKFGIKITELAASKVYLFKEQSHRGRVIVASKRHVSEMIDLDGRHVIEGTSVLIPPSSTCELSATDSILFLTRFERLAGKGGGRGGGKD